jgi:hypothetical protein
MSFRNGAAAAVAGLFLLAASGAPGAAADLRPDDAARYLAGLAPSPESPLAGLAREPAWRQHAKVFDAAWQKLEREQLSRIRAWSSEHLTNPRDPLLYFFSGPDFLYANAFFPDASTYVLVGLEAIGNLPDNINRLRGWLPQLRASLYTVLNLTFFITQTMREQITEGRGTGTLPILYVFLARAGKAIRHVELVYLDEDGNLESKDVDRSRAARLTPGVRIVFAGAGGPAQILYYFRSDLSDSGVRKSGVLKFCEKFEIGGALLKSASYLLHSRGFARARDFLLARSRLLVQDDSGIPLGAFTRDEWLLKPFGRYLQPIATFSEHYQPRLRQLYQRGNPPRIDFGIGYRWRPNETNLLLAVRGQEPPSASEPPVSRQDANALSDDRRSKRRSRLR